MVMIVTMDSSNVYLYQFQWGNPHGQKTWVYGCLLFLYMKLGRTINIVLDL